MKTATAIEAIKMLAEGGVGVMPTDTVYGLVARASDKTAVARFYQLKNRSHKPGTVVAESVEQLAKLGVPKRYLDQVSQWWPAALSVEIPLGDDLSYLHQDTGRQAFRVVADARLRAVLQQTGPLVTSSANKPGEPGAVNVAQAHKYFGDKVDFYLSGGDRSGHSPSTIIRVTDDGVEVIREGAVKIHAIRTDPKPDCPLCRANGVFKGEVLHQSGSAYLTRATTNPEYYLIIPEAHVESPSDLPDEWWAEVKAMLAAMPDLPSDYNISINIGREAGQSLGHLHFWLIGRTAGQPSSGKGFARLIDEANQI